MDEKEITLPPSQKFILIRSVIMKFNLRNMVSHLCKVAGVSRSGYYNYFSVSSQEQRKQKSDRDEILKETILKALRFRNRKKGARQIKMTLAGQFQVVYNLKRIRRIMKKYEIVCPVRKANPYKRMLKNPEAKEKAGETYDRIQIIKAYVSNRTLKEIMEPD